MNFDRRLNKSLFIIQLIASFLVVAGHFTADAFWYGKPFWLVSLNQVSRFGTVLLAIITGYFAASTFENKNPSWWGYFSSKIKYIIIPYLIAGFIFHYLLHKEVPYTLDAYIDILLGKTGAHLYFVFMLIQYYVFSFLFRKLITKKNILMIIWLLLGVQYVYINYVHQGWLGLTTRHIFLTWIFTFYVGHMIYWYRERIFAFLQKQHAALILGTTMMAVALSYFAITTKIYSAVHLPFVFTTILTLIIGAVFLFDVEKWIKVKFHKGLTFYIYLFHSAVLILLDRLILETTSGLVSVFTNTWYTLAYLAIVYGLSLILSFAIIYLIKLLEYPFRKKTAQINITEGQ